MMFFTLEFIGLSNICVHVRIFREMRNTFIDTHRSLVNSQRSDQSDHDTRIRYPGWAASKQSLQAPLPFFLPQVTLGLLRSLSSRDSYHLLYFPGAHFCRTLSDLLSQSDFIVLCTPLTSETTKRVLIVFRSGPYELKEMNNLPYLIRFGHFLLQLMKFIAHKRRLPNVCQIKSCDCVIPSNGSFSGSVLYSPIKVLYCVIKEGC